MTKSWLLAITLVSSLAAVAVAYDLGTSPPEKVARDFTPNVPSDIRQGGDTFLDDISITTVPFVSVGTIHQP